MFIRSLAPIIKNCCVLNVFFAWIFVWAVQQWTNKTERRLHEEGGVRTPQGESGKGIKARVSTHSFLSSGPLPFAFFHPPTPLITPCSSAPGRDWEEFCIDPARGHSSHIGMSLAGLGPTTAKH
ncbi:hypothetical protein FN846DRAFT_974016 [Sphaerosporella brunnea]|uniref:Uncharacterized protein n=1 Tax=Sphaerosporella brunnea TaxID=1250544 RepID=A0A5J5EFI1_9PEZI|nr:hypothetical protein FN846DRAFT_974016 [Sphaerosporella brunnea]